MKRATVAVCTCNRAQRLPSLVERLRRQRCQVPFEILVVDNNSKDGTQEVLKRLHGEKGAPLRFVREDLQGIVHARNKAIEESLGSSYLAFMDDDEAPGEGWLNAAIDALEREGADCVGGDIIVSLPENRRPGWLTGELLGFLGEVRQSASPFWITDRSTPVWSGNIAYRTSVFAEGLRFDSRYNRIGEGVGGGEDYVMFCSLLEKGARIRYRPDMVIEHFVDEWKLKRGYFLKLHYTAGKKEGLWKKNEFKRTFFGVPPFMVSQALKQWGKTLGMFMAGRPGALRQAMNWAYTIGMIEGRLKSRRARRG